MGYGQLLTRVRVRPLPGNVASERETTAKKARRRGKEEEGDAIDEEMRALRDDMKEGRRVWLGFYRGKRKGVLGDVERPFCPSNLCV